MDLSSSTFHTLSSNEMPVPTWFFNLLPKHYHENHGTELLCFRLKVFGYPSNKLVLRSNSDNFGTLTLLGDSGGRPLGMISPPKVFCLNLILRPMFIFIPRESILPTFRKPPKVSRGGQPPNEKVRHGFYLPKK
jgi:hypothetical protein